MDILKAWYLSRGTYKQRLSRVGQPRIHTPGHLAKSGAFEVVGTAASAVASSDFAPNLHLSQYRFTILFSSR